MGAHALSTERMSAEQINAENIVAITTAACKWTYWNKLTNAWINKQSEMEMCVCGDRSVDRGQSSAVPAN